MRSVNRRSPRSISRQTTTSLRKFTRVKLNEEFKTFGLELTKFVIENISLPPEVEAAMDKRTSMGVIGDVGRYAQFQAADAMRDAAQNPSVARARVWVSAPGSRGQCDGGRDERCDEPVEREQGRSAGGRRALSEVWSSELAWREVLY